MNRGPITRRSSAKAHLLTLVTLVYPLNMFYSSNTVILMNHTSGLSAIKNFEPLLGVHANLFRFIYICNWAVLFFFNFLQTIGLPISLWLYKFWTCKWPIVKCCFAITIHHNLLSTIYVTLEFHYLDIMSDFSISQSP